MQNHTNGTNRPKPVGAMFGAIALSLTALLVPGCDLGPANQGDTTETAQEVVNDSDALIGQKITIRNTVEEEVGNNGFIVNTQNGDRLLVINATGTPFQVSDREVPIQASGTVETFSAAQIQNQYGVQLDPNLFADYDNQPVLVAASMALAPNPRIFYEAPQGTFENQQIAVEGEVRLLESTNNAFALFEEGWVDDVGVLVLGVDQYLQGVPIEEGENVAVTGQARQLNEQVLREANLGWNDNQIQEFVERYTDRPVIIADGVYPSAVPPVPGS
ncbi:MAG: hypothetical protein F6K32_07485 [Desertifilum sp. SIO1I2]|nr:hypothetical protein [Desertifilum sp. SIO1I2]